MPKVLTLSDSERSEEESKGKELVSPRLHSRNKIMGFDYAIISAILHAIKEGVKKRLTKTTDILFILWAASVFSLPIFTVGLISEGIPEVTSNFWLAAAAFIPLFFVSSLMLIKAEKISPLALTLPFLSLTPILMLLTSWIMINEVPNVWGIIGILLIPLGAFLLNIKYIDHGILAPFKAIGKEKGSLLAIGVAIIWSITANLDKIAINNSSIFFYQFIVSLSMAVFSSILLAIKHKGEFIREIKENIWLFVLIGILFSVAIGLQMLAIQKILVSYVITIKRAGMVLGGIIIGAVFFKEKDFKYHLLGGLVMTAGVLLILLFH